MCRQLLDKLLGAAIVLFLVTGCASNGSARYAPTPESPGIAATQDDVSAGAARLQPSTLLLNDVLDAVERTTVRGIAPGKPIRIASNTCGNNLRSAVSGKTITVRLQRLFEINPNGCTIAVDAGGVKLPLTVHVPPISFKALQLPVGSTLGGNVLKLPDGLLASLVTPTLQIVEPDYNGAFQYVSENCFGESLLLAQLLKPTMSQLNKLSLQPISRVIIKLSHGAICGVVVSDMAGHRVTLIVHIPSKLP